MLRKGDDTLKIISTETKTESLLYEPISLVIPQVLEVFNMYEWQEILHPSAVFKLEEPNTTTI